MAWGLVAFAIISVLIATLAVSIVTSDKNSDGSPISTPPPIQPPTVPSKPPDNPDEVQFASQLGPDDTHIGIPVPLPTDTIGTPPGPYPFPVEDEEDKQCPGCDVIIGDPVPPRCPLCETPMDQDSDNNGKGGGGDPLVVGDGWYYAENDREKCKPMNVASFDYDNDGHPEYFCYNIVGNIFVIDFDGDGYIRYGYEMLNLVNTSSEGNTPVEFLNTNPDICEKFDCYLWKESNFDWVSQQKELTPYNLKISQYIDLPYKEGEKCTYHSNNRCMYGYGITDDGKEFFALMPAYWENIGE